MEPHDVWMEDQVKRLITLTEAQNAETKYALGWNFLGIGIGLVIGGATLFIPSVEWKRMNPRI